MLRELAVCPPGEGARQDECSGAGAQLVLFAGLCLAAKSPSHPTVPVLAGSWLPPTPHPGMGLCNAESLEFYSLRAPPAKFCFQPLTPTWAPGRRCHFAFFKKWNRGFTC